MPNRSEIHELRLLVDDAVVLRDVFLAIEKHPNGGVISLAIPPVLALFVVELVEWLKRGGTPPRSAPFQRFDSELRTLRAHLKVFDDTKNGFPGVARRLMAAERHSVNEFNKSHRGFLGPLKRWLQPDLGLYFLNGHLVCTTHIAALNTRASDNGGISSTIEPFEGLSKRKFDFGYSIGRILGALCAATSQNPEPDLRPATQPQLVRYDDFKAGRFYAGLDTSLGVSVGYGAAFTWLICRVNFTHRWLRVLLPTHSPLFLRVRFLAAYHAVNGLRIMSSGPSRDRTTRICTLAANILTNSNTRTLRHARKLRNVLAHYDLSAASDSELSAANPLASIIERLSNRAMADVSEMVDDVLESMSNAFSSIVTPSQSSKAFDD